MSFISSSSRRNLLKTAPLFGAGLLMAGCSVFSANTINGVTTVKIDVSRLDAYSKAIISGASTLLANPLIANALGPVKVAAATLLFSSIESGISKIDASAVNTGGVQTLVFNATSVPAALTSIEGDVSTLFADIKNGFTGASKPLSATAIQAYDAFETIVALIQVMIPAVKVSKRMMAVKKMTGSQALAILNID